MHPESTCWDETEMGFAVSAIKGDASRLEDVAVFPSDRQSRSSMTWAHQVSVIAATVGVLQDLLLGLCC